MIKRNTIWPYVIGKNAIDVVSDSMNLKFLYDVISKDVPTTKKKYFRKLAHLMYIGATERTPNM